MLSPKNDKLFSPGGSLAIIFLLTIATKIGLAFNAEITADACGYLDIARNLCAGKGFTISFNLYQYWVDTALYPAFAYMQGLYSIIIAPVYCIFKSIVAINVFNVILAGCNAMLVYVFLKRRYQWHVAIAAGIAVGLARPMNYTAIFAWTEQLHITILLLSCMLFVGGIESGKKHTILLGGILMGIGYLVRSANIYAIIVFVIAIFCMREPMRKNIQHAAIFLFGSGIVIVPYVLFGLLRYHEVYPAYAGPSTAYRLAEIFSGGYYALTKPALRFAGFTNAQKLHMLLQYPFTHIFAFIRQLGALAFFIIPAGIWAMSRRRLTEMLLFYLCVGHILLYAISFYWLPEIESPRYVLIPVITMLMLVFIMVDEGSAIFSDRFLSARRKQIFIYTVSFFVALDVLAIIDNHQRNLSVESAIQKKTLSYFENEAFTWIRKNTPPEEVVSTNYVQRIFALDRPVVSLPPGVAMTKKNLVDYFALYHPRYILDAYWMPKDGLADFGYEVVFSNRMFQVFSKTKNSGA